ncbi:CHAP domain-containing protein [Streptomyces xanthochromogenes]|uniref:CHAP domain-containing protein n=1 Tax=Streptomyces xanthochromogenes TaxID=67384 RepID=UPI001677D58E|nr:CHAP domain-containing protein [Streptomyces xanthochromogenes]
MALRGLVRRFRAVGVATVRRQRLGPGGAITFKNRTGSNWHNDLTNVQVGDVIGWRFGTVASDDHVSIVVAVTSTTLTVIEGNVGSYPSHVLQNTYARTVNNSGGISGYATLSL